jgi:hypothetical protein
MRALIPVSISALAIALAAGAATAGGNEPKGGATAQFESLDRNSDQRLSQSEAATDETVASHFAALDVDGDGYVTKREYKAHMQKDRQDEPQSRPMPDNPRDPY